MRNYEVTFIVDPVLSNEDIEGTARNYKEHIEQDGEVVHIDHIGLRQLAYPINKRTSGVYYCIEFTTDSHDIINALELALRRDERVMRFLTVKLDKYGVKYNDDKRKGLIGKRRREEEEAAKFAEESSKKEQKQESGGSSASAETVTAAVADEEE